MDKVQNDKIIDKVKKCLALSKSSEPHEAAAALRQAQKLMEAYGISDMHLKFADIGETKVKSKFSVSRVKDYELHLVSLIAKAFNCKILWGKSNSYADDVYGKFTLIGLNSQIQLAAYTCEVMQRKLVKSRNEFVASLGELNRQQKVREADGFCHGWVGAITKTVNTFADNKEVAGLIEEYIAQKGRVVSGRAQSRSAGRLGYAAGQEAARGETIQKPINTGKEALRLR